MSKKHFAGVVTRGGWIKTGYYTIGDVARKLKISRNTVRKWSDNGKLPAIEKHSNGINYMPKNATDECIGRIRFEEALDRRNDASNRSTQPLNTNKYTKRDTDRDHKRSDPTGSLVNITEAAEICGVSISFVRNRVNRGTFPKGYFYKEFGNRRMYDRKEIEAYAKKLKQANKPDEPKTTKEEPIQIDELRKLKNEMEKMLRETTEHHKKLLDTIECQRMEFEKMKINAEAARKETHELYEEFFLK